jgi:hypothetical protein
MLREVNVVGSIPTGTTSRINSSGGLSLDSSHFTIGAARRINSSVVECDPSKVVTWVRFPFDATRPFHAMVFARKG